MLGPYPGPALSCSHSLRRRWKKRSTLDTSFSGDKRHGAHTPLSFPATNARPHVRPRRTNGASILRAQTRTGNSRYTHAHTYTGDLYPGRCTHTHDSAAHVATHANVPEATRRTVTHAHTHAHTHPLRHLRPTTRSYASMTRTPRDSAGTPHSSELSTARTHTRGRRRGLDLTISP